MELDQVEEVAHDVRYVRQLVGATIVLAPGVHSHVLDLLVRLQAVAGQDESDHVLGQQAESVQFEYLVGVRIHKFEHLSGGESNNELVSAAQSSLQSEVSRPHFLTF